MAVLPIRNMSQENALRAGQVQPAAQANVPVIPNNGNPAGAYNMPGATAPQPAAPSFFQYSAASPSPYMQSIYSLLSASPAVATQEAQQAPPVMQEQAPMPQVGQAPVLPMRASVGRTLGVPRQVPGILPLRRAV